jgi:hypothetical protein
MEFMSILLCYYITNNNKSRFDFNKTPSHPETPQKLAAPFKLSATGLKPDAVN